MIVDKDNPPDIFGTNVFSTERGVDPWHKDAFPEGYRRYGKKGIRREGWFCLDGFGNVISFVPDGTVWKIGKMSKIKE